MGELPRVPRQEIILLTAHAYYDGPQAGTCEWNGKRYWFDAVYTFDEDEYPNLCNLIDLPAEKWAEIDEIDELFRKHVGRQWDYDRETQRLNPYDQEPHGLNFDAYFNDPRVVGFEDPEGPAVAQFYLYEKENTDE